jgi:uncharacterized membrane protein YphA (DoxX/SURF4 family)
MKAAGATRAGSALDLASVLARWLVGAMFLYTGLNKALQPVEFLKLIRQYDLAQQPLLLNTIAALLPWVEVVCGVLLVAGVAVRGSALLTCVLLLPFTVLVIHRARELQAALGIPFCAVKFDCGCGTGEVFICRKVLENGLLFLLALGLTLRPRGRWCVRFALQPPPRGE